MAVAVGDPVILGRMPGYRVATTTATSDSSTFTTTETVVMTVVGSLIDGVKYRIVFDGAFEISSADSTLRTAIREDDVSGTNLAAEDRRILNGVGATLQGLRCEAEYTATATGSKTFVATGDLINGAGTANLSAITAAPSRLYIEVVE